MVGVHHRKQEPKRLKRVKVAFHTHKKSIAKLRSITCHMLQCYLPHDTGKRSIYLIYS